MSIDRTRRNSFEETSDIYNETCSSYPKQLVEDIITLSGIPPDGRILEIGCGPGNATLLFARCGFDILAVELGSRLAAYAVENCCKFPKVKVVNMAFEDWPVEPGAFDLALSADAFHWIEPKIGYHKVVQALKKDGWIALFWIAPPRVDGQLSNAMSQVYLERAPKAENPINTFTVGWIIETVCNALEYSHLFGEVKVIQYSESEKMIADQYIKGLWTYSSHKTLDEPTRTHLYEGLREAIMQFGGSIELHKQVVLFLAKKE
jgi:SAM-dependent methyltransferase